MRIVGQPPCIIIAHGLVILRSSEASLSCRAIGERIELGVKMAEVIMERCRPMLLIARVSWNQEKWTVVQ